MTYRQAKDLKMLPINSMNPTNTPPQLVDFITLSEVSSICEIDESELMDLVDYGAIHYHHFLNGDGLVSTQNIARYLIFIHQFKKKLSKIYIF